MKWTQSKVIVEKQLADWYMTGRCTWERWRCWRIPHIIWRTWCLVIGSRYTEWSACWEGGNIREWDGKSGVKVPARWNGQQKSANKYLRVVQENCHWRASTCSLKWVTKVSQRVSASIAHGNHDWVLTCKHLHAETGNRRQPTISEHSTKQSSITWHWNRWPMSANQFQWVIACTCVVLFAWF